jgi:hypothetical protein
MALTNPEDPVVRRPAGRGPAGKPARPDWLVGAEEGVDAELAAGLADRLLPQPQLTRPSAPPPDETRGPAGPPPLLITPGALEGGPARMTSLPDVDRGWAGHGEWVPKLETSADAGLFPDAPPARDLVKNGGAAPDPREEDIDDGADLPPAGGGQFHAHRDVPAGYREEPALDRAQPPAPKRSFVDAAGAAAGAFVLRHWIWFAGALAAGLAVGPIVNAIGPGTTPLSRILRNPEGFDGQIVRVRGRVGQDVFPVGGGYTFYLIRGRDSLVVFTRTRAPEARQRLEVAGQVSTGMLGGEPRPALLEQVGGK